MSLNGPNLAKPKTKTAETLLSHLAQRHLGKQSTGISAKRLSPRVADPIWNGDRNISRKALPEQLGRYKRAAAKHQHAVIGNSKFTRAMTVNYKVNIVREGRGGWVYYCEDKAILPFDWDITSDGFEVYLPPATEWDDFCKKNNAMQFIGRHEQIVERLAEEVRSQGAKKAKVTIDDLGIRLSFEGDWLHSLVSRILGV